MKIGIDIDDVLLGFYPAYCKHYNIEQKQCDIWSIQDSGVTLENLNKLGVDFWQNLIPVFKVSEIGFHIDYYITSFDGKYIMNRIKNMIDYGFPIREFICCKSKDKINHIIEKGIDIFIDDNPDTIKTIRDSDCKCVPIQFIPPYSTTKVVDGVMFAKNYKELNNLLK